MVGDGPRQEIQASFARLQQEVSRIRYAHEHYRDSLETVFARRRHDIQATAQERRDRSEREYHGQMAAARASFEQVAMEVRKQIGDMVSAFRWSVADWDDPAWSGYAPAAESPLPAGIRIGRLDLGEPTAFPPLPALAPLVGRGHLFLLGEQEIRPAAIRLLQIIVLRLLVATHPGTLRLILADPFSAGTNLAMFRRLPDELRGAKIWSSPQEIEAQLQQLANHIESVIQTRLISPEATIERYNRERPEQRVPYQILALADFPASFSERMTELLLAVARNGPRAGVYVVSTINAAYPMPRNFDLGLLTALGTSLRLTGMDRLSWNDPAFARCAVALDPLPAIERIDALLAAVGAEAARNTPDLSFGRIAVPSDKYWQGTTLDGLWVPIGFDSAGTQHSLRLGQDPGVVHHGLIGGASGSGKGNLLHVLITQLALQYPPEELGLYLLDFKEGVEFQRYIGLPHARAVALESEREFGLNVLRHLQAEMEERGRLFKGVGAGVSKYADYRRQTGRPLPRLVLIIDEFQVLFKDDDAMAREAAQVLEDLAKRGRSAAIHVLLCSQSPSTGGPLLTRVYDQMGLRIALQCRARDALAILGEGNDAAAHLERVGEAIYNDKMGERDKNQAVRVAFLADLERGQALESMQELAGGRSYPPPITFDGRAQAQLEDNPLLTALLAQPGWSHADTAAHVWLGEPIDLKSPTVATLERYARSNLMILGENEVQALGLLVAAVLSLAAQRSPDEAEFFVAEFARPDTPFAGFFAPLGGVAGGPALPQALTIAGPRQAGSLLARLLDILKERLASDSVAGPELYFFVAGLHRWRELRGPDSITQSEVGKGLTRLADEGPDLGIHVIGWADTLTTIEQAFKRGGLKYFDLRVGLRLGERDSTELLGASIAARLEDNRAYFRHEDWETGRREKFKPYAIPAREQVQKLLAQLAGKAAVRGEAVMSGGQ